MVLEVPIPEEMFNQMGSNAALLWHNMRTADKFVAAVSNSTANSSANEQFMLLLKLVGAAFIPYPVQLDHTLTRPIKDGTIEASTAKYIVHQYIAATGGLGAINAVNSMYAVGQVKMVVVSGMEQNGETATRTCEAGGFVLWQKNPDLWYLELVVSGFKISAGSDGKVAWSQSSSNSNASKGPPRPLRRFFQGLDPRSTANLFINAVCIGEKTVMDEECFSLKLETCSELLKSQSTVNTEIVHHTIWGYFSQRSGLLIKFEDTKLIRMKTCVGDDSVFYETSIESVMDDYRTIEGINIAHSGTTSATLYRYGKTQNRKWKLEESWTIEEIDFNICGLSMEYFLPPADVKKESEQDENGIR